MRRSWLRQELHESWESIHWVHSDELALKAQCQHRYVTVNDGPLHVASWPRSNMVARIFI